MPPLDSFQGQLQALKFITHAVGDWRLAGLFCSVFQKGLNELLAFRSLETSRKFKFLVPVGNPEGVSFTSLLLPS